MHASDLFFHTGHGVLKTRDVCLVPTTDKGEMVVSNCVSGKGIVIMNANPIFGLSNCG
jgi:hypothetical protein